MSWQALWTGFKEFWWLILALALAAIGVTIDRRARDDEKRKAELKEERQINSQREEAASRVEAFNEAARAVEHMPEHELRERTETDPNNRGRVQRD